ncbi:MAG: phosphoribosylformylglycinamidine synthase subunit PurQ [Hyphomicrobiaceae bacterium]
MKSTVVVFPGSNCDRDMKVALERATGADVTMAWHGNTDFAATDLIVLPGGFSYGDYLRPGAMAAKSPIMASVIARAKAGTPVLGICNGFQILCETGLLPGVLMRNASLRYVCRDVHVKVEQTDTPFTRAYSNGDVLRIPIAHHDGNYFAEPDILDRLESDGRIVVRYCDADGDISSGANPNGSQRNIAGICDENRRIVGMMPHPERLFEAALGGSDGRGVLDSMNAAVHAATGS